MWNPGDAKLTGAYGLPARYVIHAVGPVWKGGSLGEAALLARCYRRCFAIADLRQLASIAFPAMSTGAYGYPLDRATRIAVTETRKYLESGRTLPKVTFACVSSEVQAVYRATIDEITDV